jgi:hypothetical protein
MRRLNGCSSFTLRIFAVMIAAPMSALAWGCSDTSDGGAPDVIIGAGEPDAAAAAGGSAGAAAGTGGSAGDAVSMGGAAGDQGGGSSGDRASADAAVPAVDAGRPQPDARSVPDATTRAVPSPVLLGAAGTYVILAKSAVSNVPTSMITGNIGLSPAAATYITGLSLTRAGTKWASPEVVGGVFAADNDPPTPVDLTTAISNMETAYNDAAARPSPGSLNLGAGSIGGRTLAPGLYKWTSTLTIPDDIEIAGAPEDVWIFQISGNLMLSAAKRMTLSGGARAKNIFWQVAGNVDLGTTSHAEGIILAKTAVTLATGASINGRLLAQTAVSVAGGTVTAPAP